MGGRGVGGRSGLMCILQLGDKSYRNHDSTGANNRSRSAQADGSTLAVIGARCSSTNIREGLAG